MSKRKKGEWGERSGDAHGDASTSITDLQRFEAAASSFGGDLVCWPPERRMEAEAFLARGGEAAERALEVLAEEKAFDALIADAAFVDTRLSEAQLARFTAGAARVRPSRVAQLADEAAELLERLKARIGRQISQDRGLRVSLSDLRVSSFGGLCAAAAVAGLAFGLFGPMATTSLDGGFASSADSAFFDAFGAEDELDFFVQDLDFESDAAQEMDG